MRERTDKLDFIKIRKKKEKNFCSVTDSVKRMTRQATDWKKIFAKVTSNEVLLLISGSGRSPGEGNGNPLQYCCLENPKDGGTWQATVHGVTKSRTQLSNFIFTFTFIQSIQRKLLKSNSKKMNKVCLKMSQRSEQTALQRRYTAKHMGSCSTSFLHHGIVN